ncbi:MAG: hypothetical protein IPJ51_11855 [Saprospiraceae bacterium]|nr:hypothetical protein [Saprospiraceae bacterium]
MALQKMIYNLPEWQLSADVTPGLNTTVPESKGSDGRTNGALMSKNLLCEKIEMNKIALVKDQGYQIRD